MRSWANQLREYYGNISITYPGGAPIGGAHNVAAVAGQSALTEYAGNANTIGSTSLAIGQTATGAATILARGAQSLTIGANAGGQISIASGGAITLATATTISTGGLTITAGGLSVSAGGASITGQTTITSNATVITDNTGLVMNAATGGAQGAGTINCAGVFVNGVAVGTPAAFSAFRTAALTRTSNATPTADPVLTVALAANTSYRFRCVVTISSSSAGGFAGAMGYSGTYNTTGGNGNFQTAYGRANSVWFNAAESGLANSMFNGSTTVTMQAGTNGGADFFIGEGMITTTGAGNLALFWAQNTSNATGTTLQAGSYLEVVQL
jgi:hypothetical protein